MVIQVVNAMHFEGPTGQWQHSISWPGGRGRIYVASLTASGSSAKIAVTASSDAGGESLPDIDAAGTVDFELPACTIAFDVNVTGSDELQTGSIRIAALYAEGL